MPNNVTTKRIVNMVFKNKDFEKKAKQSMNTLDQLEEKLRFKGVEDGVKRIDQVLGQIDVSKLDKALDTINYRLSTTGIATAKILSNVIDGITAKLNGLFTIIKTKGEARARNIENATFSMKSLFGETKEGLKMVEEMMGDGGPVRSAVAGTRFGLDEAAGAAAMFAAAGVESGEKMESVLKSVAGVATVTNRSFADISDVLADMSTRGYASGDTLSRLAERNFNLTKDLQEALGKTAEEIQSMARKREISADTVFEVLQKYADASQKANDTYDGAYENLKAALGRMSVDIEANWRETKRKVFVDLIRMIDNFTYAMKKGIALLNEFVSGLGAMVQSLLQNDYLIASIMMMFGSLHNIGKALIIVFNQLADALFGWMPIDFVEVIHAAGIMLYTFSAILAAIVEANQDKIRVFFDTILSPIGLLLKILGKAIVFIWNAAVTVANAISMVIDKVKTAFSLVADTGFFNAIALLFTSIWDGLAPARSLLAGFGKTVAGIFGKILPSSDAVLAFFTFLAEKITEFATFSGSALEFLGKQIKEFFGLFKNFKMPEFSSEGVTGGIVSFANNVKAILEGVRDAFDEIFGMSKVHAAGSGGMGQIAEETGPAVTVLDKFKQVIENLAPYMEDFNKAADKFVPILLSIARILVFKEFADGYKASAEAFAGIGKSVSGMFKSISGTFDAFSERIQNFGKQTKTQIFFQIAASILMLAAAFKMIAELNRDQITQAAAVMVGFFVAMGIMLGIATKLKVTSAGTFKMIGKGLMEIGASMVMMAAAMKIISTIVDDKGTLLKSVGAFVVMVAAVIGMIAAFGLLFKNGMFDASAIVATGGAILLISTAMIVLAGALFLLSKMEFLQMAKGLGVMAIALVEFGAALAFLGKYAGVFAARNYISIGIAMIAIAAAMNLLVPALTVLAMIPGDLIAKSLVEIGFALAEMSAALATVSHFGNGGFVGIGVGMLFMAVALDALVPALLLLAPIEFPYIAKGLIELGFALAGMSIALGLLSKSTGGLQAAGIGVGLIAIAAALNLIVPPILAIGALPLPLIEQGMIALGLALGAITTALMLLAATENLTGGGVEKAAASFTAIAASMWLLTKAIAGVAGVLALMTALDTTSMWEAAKALGLIVGVMTALLAVGALFPGLSIGMLAIGAAFVMLAGSIYIAIAAINLMLDVMERVAAMDPKTITQFVDKGKEVLDALTALVPEFIELVDAVFDGIIHILIRKKTYMAEVTIGVLVAVLEKVRDNISYIVDLAGEIIVRFLHGLNKWLPAIMEEGAKLLETLGIGIKGSLGDLIEKGKETIDKWIEGINKKVDDIKKAAEETLNNFIDAITSFPGKLVDTGKNIIDGIIGGIRGGISSIFGAGEDVGNAVLDGTADAIDSNSPSKEMMKLGNYAAEGFRLGVVKYDRIINNTGQEFGNKLLSGVEKVVGHGKGRQFSKYLESMSSAVKKFINSQKITDASGMGNHLYLKSDEYKDHVKQLKDYYKQYNDIYKKSEIDLAKSRALSGDQAEQAHDDYEQDLKDLKELDKSIIKMGKTIAQGPAKAIKQWRKELKQTIKEFLSISNLDLTSKNLDIFTSAKTSSNLSNTNNLLAGLKGTLTEVADATKATRDQYDLLNISYESGINLLERFTKVSSKSAQRMFTNAKSQLKAYEEFQAGIAQMRAMGFDESLVSSLAAKGYQEALGDVRSFQKFSADQVGEYNGLVAKQQEYEREELKKNVEETEKQYAEHLERLEDLAARGLSEGIIKRLKADGLNKEGFVKALWSMDDDYLEAFNDYYSDSVDLMNDLSAETNTTADSFRSFGEMLEKNLARNTTWTALLDQLKKKGVSDSIIKYFSDAGYDSAHVMAENLAKETPRAIEKVNQQWQEYQASEKQKSGLNWALQIEDTTKFAKDYTQNMETLASLLPQGRKNPIYQKVSSLGTEDGNEYAEAFIEADSATRERIQKAYEDEQKANADLMMSQLKDRLAKTKAWAANLKKIADETYKKSGDGHKAGDHIIGADLYNELVALGPDAADMIQDIADMSHKQLAEFAKEYNVDLDGVVDSSTSLVTKGYKEVAETAVTSFTKYMKKGETVDEIKKAVNEAIVEAAKENKKKAKEKGEVVGEAGSTAFGTTVKKGGEDGARAFYDGWTGKVDQQIAQGKWGEGNPIIEGGKQLIKTWGELFEFGSPSKLTKRHAKWFAEGWEIGIHDNEEKFSDPLLEAASNAKDALTSVNDGIQNELNTRALEYRIDLQPLNTPLNLDASLAQASQIQDIFSSISGVNFEIGRDANRDVVNAINDMRDDFEYQIDKLSTAINDMQLIMDTGALVGQIVSPMDQALGQNRALAQRGVLA